MAENYAADAADAVALIAEFGMGATLNRQGPAGSSATLDVNGNAVRAAGVPEAVQVVRTQAEATRLLKDSFSSGTVFIMAPLATPPRGDDELVVGIEVWTLTDVKTIQPAGVALVHLCSAQK